MTLRFVPVRPLILAVLVLGLLAAAVSWALVARTIAGAKPSVASGRATAIVWADRVFDTRAEFRRWLQSHGGTYVAWRERYPAAAAVLEHRSFVAAPVKRVAAARSRPARVAAAQSTGSSVLRDLILGVLVAAAIAFTLAALAPVTLLARIPALARAVVPHRELLLAGAAALAIGLVVGAVLT